MFCRISPIRQHSTRVITLIGLFRIRNSRKTEKTGEVKERTIRSPMGMRGMAARQARLTEDIRKP